MDSTEKHLFSSSVQLLGHKSGVYTTKFSPSGNLLASGSNDKQILIWDIFDSQCKNTISFKGHSGSILEVSWSRDSATLYSCSADKTFSSWDITEGIRIKKYRGHEGIVNSIDASQTGSDIAVTAGDDFAVKLWDLRAKEAVMEQKMNYQVTAVRFSQTNEYVFFGGLDNQIKAWNVKANSIEFSLLGHKNTITGIALSNDGKKLLSNSIDNTVRSWDLKPFVTNEDRELKVFMGGKHDFERNLLRCCWGPNDKYASAGSANKIVYIWGYDTGYIWGELMGHNGSVNETHINPKYPIIASASSDSTVFLGEIPQLT